MAENHPNQSAVAAGQCLLRGRSASRSTPRRAGHGTIIPPHRGARAWRGFTRPMSASWRKRFRVTKGQDIDIAPLRGQGEPGTVRGFCARCGTPLFYERARRSPAYGQRIPARCFFRAPPAASRLYHVRHRRAAGMGPGPARPLVPLEGFSGPWSGRRSKKEKKARRTRRECF